MVEIFLFLLHLIICQILTTTPLVTNQQLNSIITAIKEQKTVTIDSIKALPADTFNVNIIQPKAKPAPKPTQNPLKQPLPNKTISIVEDTINEYKHKEKVRNESGQKVIIMDSRWFVKIINDNDIFVRGFFRFQNKKNELGEWYKELIFVDSFVRHGYHRNAKIEDEENG